MAKVRKRTWTAATGEIRTAWTVDFTDSNGARQRKQFSTKRVADDFRVEIEGRLRAGTFRLDADKVTVKEVADHYVEHVKGRSKRGERFTRRHLDMVKGRIYNYICPDPKRAEQRKPFSRVTVFSEGIGGIKLSQLTARVVGDFRDRLRSAGLSIPTTRKVLTTLHAILEFAISRDIVAVNAAKRVKVIGRRDEGSKKIIPPSKDAFRRIMDVADEDFRVKIVFAAASGVRAGELHALRWHHIDFDKSEVSIETRVDAYNVEDAPKSEAGVRTVPLAADVVTLLRKWKIRSKWSKPEDLVFPNEQGRYVRHTHMLTGKFYPLFKKLDPPVSARFNWHALRHFAISCWIEAGLAPKTVQTFAGHSSLAMTMDLYGHLFKSDDHGRTMDAIAKGLFA